MSELGARIRRKRLERGLGLRQAAKLAGVSSTYLCRIETTAETHPPAEDALRRLARVLRDDHDVLMQLAGRIPADVELILIDDLNMPLFVRTAHQLGYSGADLMRTLSKKPEQGAA